MDFKWNFFFFLDMVFKKYFFYFLNNNVNNGLGCPEDPF